MTTSKNKRRAAAAKTGLYLGVVTTIVIVANAAAALTPARVDLTEAQRFTLSEGSGNLVRGLKSPLDVEFFVTTGDPLLNRFVTEVTDLLGEYERESGGNFRYTIIDTTTSEEARKQAAEAGLQELGVRSAEGASQKLVSGYLGLLLKYGEEQEVQQLDPRMDTGLEFLLSNKLRELRDRADKIQHKIGVLTGKNELKLSDNNLLPRAGQGQTPTIEQILTSNFPFYKFEKVELKDGPPIDATLDGLIITQPGDDYTESELHQVDDFMMLGGKAMAVIASAANLKQGEASMKATLSNHGLDTLLKGYGLDLQKNVVIDRKQGLTMVFPDRLGRLVPLSFPGIAVLAAEPGAEKEERLLDTGFASFFGMPQVSFPFPSEIKLLPDRQPKDVALKEVAQTSEEAIALTGDSLELGPGRNWADVTGEEDQFTIAATAEGKLQSAFAAPGAEGRRAPADSRVLVIASGEFLTNPFAFAGNGPELGGQFAMFGSVGGDKELQFLAQPYAQKFLLPTILGVKNTLDWLSNESDLVAASAKINAEPNLTFSIEPPKVEPGETPEALNRKNEEYLASLKERQQSVQWTLVAGVPLFVAALGLLRWQGMGARRRKKS